MSIGSRFEAFLELFAENGLVGNVGIPRFWGHYPLPPPWTSAHEV
nr:MAG TPA: hypothetical protein [Caudoviricetes sp.]DAX36202.1 MAG TPA: hypothetical protein [Caudoviricetes sp.]